MSAVVRMDFFSALAQVGPVLLLAFVLEARIEHSEAGPFETMFRLVGLFTTFVAEVGCLWVLAGGLSPTRSTAMQVGGLLVISVGHLAGAVGGSQLTAWPDATGWIRILFGFTGAGLLIAGAFV